MSFRLRKILLAAGLTGAQLRRKVEPGRNGEENPKQSETAHEGVIIMTMAEYLRSVRTLTEIEVDAIERKRDAGGLGHDFTASERLPIDTGSIRRVQ